MIRARKRTHHHARAASKILDHVDGAVQVDSRGLLRVHADDVRAGLRRVNGNGGEELTTSFQSISLSSSAPCATSMATCQR